MIADHIQVKEENSTGMDTQNYKLKDIPQSVYYIPNFITEEEEELLLSKVYSAPKPKWTQLAHRRLQNWGGLPHAKGMVAEALPEWLQVYVDRVSQLSVFEGKVPNHVLVNEYLSGQGIMPHEDGPVFYPVVSTISLGSHTLLDFYHHRDTVESRPGKGEDTTFTEGGEESTDKNSEATVSRTGNPVEEEDTLTADNLQGRHFESVLLERRSLVLVCEDMYTQNLHGIAERKHDTVTDKIANLGSLSVPLSIGESIERDTRVSLTIRHVPRTIKAKFLFGRR